MYDLVHSTETAQLIGFQSLQSKEEGRQYNTRSGNLDSCLSGTWIFLLRRPDVLQLCLSQTLPLLTRGRRPARSSLTCHISARMRMSWTLTLLNSTWAPKSRRPRM
ncbi:hypothetical protein ATANTOWER_007516 [Ataeniobius toweri]|uniref:Uncharacterized protein n=1 Tax=Ataeniobius toweri TaxID=208326 RepID=A0ABU7A9W2_9TELE|nr:hypothetical protein [Ataeniobius toweri]